MKGLGGGRQLRWIRGGCGTDDDLAHDPVVLGLDVDTRLVSLNLRSPASRIVSSIPRVQAGVRSEVSERTWHRMSPATNESPTLTFHSVTVPSVIVGDSAGIVNDVVALATAELDTAAGGGG